MSKLSKLPGLAVLSILGIAGCVLGWMGSLIGPGCFVLFGLLGFTCGMIACILTGALGKKAEAGEKPEAGETDRLERALRRAVLIVGIVTVVSVLSLLITASLTGGVGKPPAFETRAVYEVESRGRRIPVSRLRYILTSAFFFTGWHAGALFFNVCALHGSLYGTKLFPPVDAE